jgi:hypothetical protein
MEKQDDELTKYLVEVMGFQPNSEFSNYVAISSAGLRIISVSAHNFKEARVLITEELGKPGRQAILHDWQISGQQIIS